MNFGEAVQEVTDRGYHYIATARKERFVNRAHKALCSKHPWPFLEDTQDGISPVVIADLGHVLDVVDTVQPENLDPIDPRRVRRMDPTLSETGAAVFYFLEGDGTVRSWPASSNKLRVRYLRRAVDLSGTEAFLVPEEHHELIVDWAVTYCLKDDDEYDESQKLKGQVEEGVVEMFHALIPRNYGRPELIGRTGPPGSYL